MKVLTAIDELDNETIYHLDREYHTVFLAGGISNCSDWQSEAIEYLNNSKYTNNVILFNPRRKSFDINNPEDSIIQIAWEHKYLQLAKHIIFWFTEETLCPITLFEYGKALVTSKYCKKYIYIGTHPEYQRRLDLVEQTFHENERLIVRNNLIRTIQDFEVGLMHE